MPRSRTFVQSHQNEILVFFLFLVAYIPAIIWMWGRWFSEGSYYSHGILVPLISFFFIWEKRNFFKKPFADSSPWGLRLFILGIIIYWASAFMHVYFSSGFSMLIVIAGLILYFYGAKAFREISFPLLFLIFMIPLPLIVIALICFKLKILAAQAATFILNAIGLSAVQETSIIKMNHSYVLVEDSCGGLRSLVSLTALGSIFAYRLKANFLKRTLLFLSAIPIATITNAFRIVFLSAVGEIFGTQYTQGILHDFSGYSVFAFAFLLLFVVKQLLESQFL